MVSLPSSAERERPAEWLDALKDEGGYGRLLADAGSLAVAAHRVACALCRTQAMPSALPTLRELEAAARLVAGACGLAAPSGRVLLQACDLAGLDVIEPIERTPSSPRVAAHHGDDVRAYAY
jgi:hypothetical protein